MGDLALSFLLVQFQEIARYKSYLTRASVRLGTSGGEGTMANMSHSHMGVTCSMEGLNSDG